MKILVLSTVPYQTNGISMVIQNLYANEIFSNEDITFVFPADNNTEMTNTLLDLGYRVITNENRSKKPFRYIRFLIKFMKEENFDIVHVHGSSATNAIELWAAFRAKIPIRIMHCHSNKNKYAVLHKMLKPIVNWLCTERFACSDEAGRFLYGKQTFKVINNAFDVSKYKFDPQKRCELRKLLGFNESTVVFGHVGCINVAKNQQFLVRAFRLYHEKHPDSALILIGDGNNRPNIEKEISDAGLNNCVKLLGARRDVFELVNAMDCFVFPSMHEGLGIAPIEAQANGLSVISACDNVPAKIKINQNFSFMSLSQGETAWATRMHEISKERDTRGITNVCEAGFDISNERRNLYDTYRNLLDKLSAKGT